MIDPEPIIGPYFWIRLLSVGKPDWTTEVPAFFDDLGNPKWIIGQTENELWWPVNGELALQPDEVEVGPKIDPPC